MTSLKGHTGQILDMDFSANGKFLATCADDETRSTDPGGGGGGGGSSDRSSGSEANKENASPTSRASGLSRRQRKNRSRREDASPPTPGAAPRGGGGRKTRGRGRDARPPPASGPAYAAALPLRQHAKLNLNDCHLAVLLRHYLLGPDQLLSLGFPVESALFPGRAIIYKAPGAPHVGTVTPPPPAPSRAPHLFDVNAREFVPAAVLAARDENAGAERRRLSDMPGMDYLEIGAEWAAGHHERGGGVDRGSTASSGGDSSLSPSPASSSDDALEDSLPPPPSTPEETPSPASAPKVERPWSSSLERRCVRCGRGFFVTVDGEYLTQERCTYHWGKLQAAGRGRAEYNCCKARAATKGCAAAPLHVWVGVGEGINGPLDGFVRTRPRKSAPPDGNFGVYALDCEMCFTTHGLELAKITVVASDGRLVYDCFVKPDNDIVDYNTRFSGITARDLARKGAAKTLKEVQNDLMGFINSDTILVGHGLENDLRALRIIHGTIVDTSVVFPHYYGLPYRRSLKSLVGCLLKRDIQKSSGGHDSFEDARACVELMLWRVRKDFRNLLNN